MQTHGYGAYYSSRDGKYVIVIVSNGTIVGTSTTFGAGTGDRKIMRHMGVFDSQSFRRAVAHRALVRVRASAKMIVRLAGPQLSSHTKPLLQMQSLVSHSCGSMYGVDVHGRGGNGQING